MPKDTKTLGNSKARACESLGFVHKKGCARVLTQPPPEKLNNNLLPSHQQFRECKSLHGIADKEDGSTNNPQNKQCPLQPGNHRLPIEHRTEDCENKANQRNTYYEDTCNI